MAACFMISFSLTVADCFTMRMCLNAVRQEVNGDFDTL